MSSMEPLRFLFLLAHMSTLEARLREAQEDAAREARRQAAEQRQAETTAKNNSQTSRGSGSAFLGGLIKTVGQTVLQQKYGIPPSPQSSVSPSTGDCMPPAAANILSQCQSGSSGMSACQTAQYAASCLLRAESACGGCGSCVSDARGLRQSFLATAAQVCSR